MKNGVVGVKQKMTNRSANQNPSRISESVGQPYGRSGQMTENSAFTQKDIYNDAVLLGSELLYKLWPNSYNLNVKEFSN